MAENKNPEECKELEDIQNGKCWQIGSGGSGWNSLEIPHKNNTLTQEKDVSSYRNHILSFLLNQTL